VERWVKWDWEDPNGPAGEEIGKWAKPTGPWLTVRKTRLQRKYGWDDPSFTPVNPKEMVQLGAAIEITTLMVKDVR
jgi:hypothetical protein